jgi:hypothetical protein
MMTLTNHSVFNKISCYKKQTFLDAAFRPFFQLFDLGGSLIDHSDESFITRKKGFIKYQKYATDLDFESNYRSNDTYTIYFWNVVISWILFLSVAYVVNIISPINGIFNYLTVYLVYMILSLLFFKYLCKAYRSNL